MNREIKFRGKCSKESKYAGEWVEGGLVVPKEIENNEVLIISAQYADCMSTYHVDKETIGQFTGLTDKNGKEIYEGDIVQWEECVADYTFVTNKSEVFYSENSASFEPLNEFSHCDFEVIGNIYDNYNLLED